MNENDIYMHIHFPCYSYDFCFFKIQLSLSFPEKCTEITHFTHTHLILSVGKVLGTSFTLHFFPTAKYQ